MKKKKVLFFCEDNATRSLIAEAVFRHLCEGEWDVYSAGACSKAPHPAMLRALAERGIGTSELVSKTTDELPYHRFDLLVTLSANTTDAQLDGVNSDFKVELPFVDPAGWGGSDEGQSRVFRQVRDQIYGRLSVLCHRVNTAGLASLQPLHTRETNGLAWCSANL